MLDTVAAMPEPVGAYRCQCQHRPLDCELHGEWSSNGRGVGLPGVGVLTAIGAAAFAVLGSVLALVS